MNLYYHFSVLNSNSEIESQLTILYGASTWCEASGTEKVRRDNSSHFSG